MATTDRPATEEVTPVTRSLQAGDLLAQRYRLDDLLTETPSGRFWRGWDTALSRPVAIHLMAGGQPGAARMIEAARGSAGLLDRRVLRVLDASDTDGISYVVNEWGHGVSLDLMLSSEGPLEPRRAAHLVAEVADTLAATHARGLAHGRLTPESVLIDRNGQVRIIGFAIDAAVHGLPPGRQHADVIDLGGLLYAALTGRWAGMSSSEVPVAPLEGGVLLRPRRVRAGIPRMLDGICDLVLNPYPTTHYRPTHDLATARGLADELEGFVGDPTGLLPPSDPVRAPYAAPPTPPAHSPRTSPESHTTVLPPTPPDGEAEEAPGADGPGEATVAVPLPDRSHPADETADAATDETADEATGQHPDQDSDQATQAGLPVWDDDTDDVAWVSTGKATPPPPPPLDPVPERPLFAPEPADGPRRRPRHAAAPASSGPLPWESDPHWDGGSSSGSGSLPAYDEAAEEDEVPGRSWMRLALIVGMCALVMVAAVAAWDLGGGGDIPEDPSEAGNDSTDRAAPVVYEQLTATDFDPQGDPPEENPESAGLAVDGDPATSWSTNRYNDQLGPPPGLKTGVGLVVDLGRVRDVSEVTVTVLGGSTSVSAYVTEDQPTGVGDLDPVKETAGDGELRMPLSTPATGRYVVVWLTALPAVEGGFRGEVAEVQVAG